ncbi:Vesicular, overexpressed in cancer, prosurvival protein 1, partial [Anabarilius grahami]
LLLMMGVLFCCGAGFFIRRRMYPSPLSEEPAFNVSFTRQPVSTPVSQQPGMQGYADPCGAMTTTLAPAYPGQTAPAHMMSSYPPPPSYCNHPPPSYEQVFKSAEKKNHSEPSQSATEGQQRERVLMGMWDFKRKKKWTSLPDRALKNLSGCEDFFEKCVFCERSCRAEADLGHNDPRWKRPLTFRITGAPKSAMEANTRHQSRRPILRTQKAGSRVL